MSLYKAFGVTGMRPAVWSLLLASTAIAGLPGAALAAAAASGNATVEEVVVTAEKRAENLQRTPLSIEVLNTRKLDQLQVNNFNDFAKFLPGVSYQELAPGFSAVYMRGVASGENSNHSGPLPSVGIYLDEQPVTTITGALDVHIYDIARVESLSGPQGTLYGASSESGTVRIITNKPEIGVYKGSFDVEANTVAHGGAGGSVQGFVNLPINDKAAIRLVGWTEHDAGYIDNVESTRCYNVSGICINNAAIARNNYNTNDLFGGRAALKIDLNENWTVTPSIMAQQEMSNGSFAYTPYTGKLEVSHFYPEFSHDHWYQAALTVEGKIGNFDITYAAALMKRYIRTSSDYTDYSYFYDRCCSYGNSLYDNSNNLINPSQYIQGWDRFTKMSHELRFSSPRENRFRFIGGLFYERQVHNIEQRYKIDNLNDSLEVPGWPDTIWLTEQQRVDRDYAAFGEASFDLTSKLTLTAGLRAYRYDNSLIGFFGFGTGFSSNPQYVCFAPEIVHTSPCTNLDKDTSKTGTTYKLNATYQIDSDHMIYVTNSTGFRPGGINRRGSLPPYISDTLTNYEFGWKTQWFDHRVRWNGAIYFERWKDFQFSFLGPNGLTEIHNAGQAEMKGAESDIIWRASEGLTLTASGTYTDAHLTADVCSHVGQTVCPLASGDLWAPSGQSLPVTPRFKGSLIARYEWPLANFTAHVQGAGTYKTSTYSDLRIDDRAGVGQSKGYGTLDLTAGLENEHMSMELFVTNVFDTLGDNFRFTECSVCALPGAPGEVYIVPAHPRTIGLRFGRKF